MMEFRIADAFTDSLAKLTGDEQKVVKTSAFDLQMNPEHPGLQLHKIDKSRDKNFWSARVSRDIRIILHRTDDSLMLCYVGHHDEAYRWAERRRLERHPRTGAAQIVEVRETVREIEVPRYVDAPEPEAPPAQPLFTDVPDDDLLGYGVPTEWLSTVRAATEDSLFDISDHLPQEAAEALLELATGNVPEPAMTIREDVSPFAHPDAQRRFRVMTNVEELERAWMRRGRNGRSSCIRINSSLSNATMQDLRGYPGLPVPGRPWLLCTAPFILPAHIRRQGSFLPHSQTPWQMPSAVV